MIPFRTDQRADASPVVTMGLIVANIAAYFFMIGLEPRAQFGFVYTYALVPAVYGQPEAARAAGLDPTSLWPFVTNTFLHAGALHLIVNLWTLWVFGLPVEDRLGRWRFLALYLGAGAAGSVGHLAFNLSSAVPALGASGAVAGVLGAFTWLAPRARVSVVQPIFVFPLILPLPALLFTGLWFGLQVIGVWGALDAAPNAGGIAWWAHLAGFAAGLGLGMVFGRAHSAHS